MSIKSKEVLPIEGDAFKNCKLNREPYAEVLTSIVENYADGFVLAVDNEWGTGKTTFIKMWRQYLEDNEFSTLYFNAWENDFENDVLVALISELEELKEAGKDEAKFKKVVDKAAPFVSKLLPSLVKSITAKYAGEGFVKDVVEGFAEITGEELQTEMQAYAKRKKGLVEFKDSLRKFIEVVTPNKPLVFFIDELDRCRPNYAVEVLEQIKHLFSVDGIVFVLSIDKEQLGHAVRGVYNSEKIKAGEYLKRFIDVEYNIPEPEVETYLDYLFNKLNLDDFLRNSLRTNKKFSEDGKELFKSSELFFKAYKVNLRKIEKIITKLKVALIGFYPNENIFPNLLFYLIFIKETDSRFYNLINTKQLSLQELVDEFEKRILQLKIPDSDKRFVFDIEARLIYQYLNFIDNNNYRLDLINFKSKLDESEDNKQIQSFIKMYKQDFHLQDCQLVKLLLRVNLVSPIPE
jgi:hypothetical protein